MNSPSTPANVATELGFECRLCGERWPEHLMVVEKKGKRLCCPCNAKQKDAARLKEQQKRSRGVQMGTPLRSKLVAAFWILLGLAVLGLIGARLYFGPSVWDFAPKVDVEKLRESAVLVEKDVRPIFLDCKMKPKSGLAAAGNAFLAKGQLGIVAVTAAPAGVRASQRAPLAAALGEWTFAASGDPKRITVSALGFHGDHDQDLADTVWQFDMDPNEVKALPVNVLQVSRVLASYGDTLRAVRLTTANGKPLQEYTKARVDRTSGGSKQLYVKLAERLPARSLIGTPLIAKSGHLVAVIAGFGEPADGLGNVGLVQAVGAVELLGLQPPTPAAQKEVNGKPAANAAPQKRAFSILPGGNPYDRPEYNDLK